MNERATFPDSAVGRDVVSEPVRKPQISEPGAATERAESAPPLSIAPPAPVRFDSLFVRLDRALARCDAWMDRWVPTEFNPLARAGAAANCALIIAVLSGVALLIWYSPSVQFAHASLAAIEGRTLGGWVRALHRYSADLAMLLLCVHAGRTLLARKFAGARWLPWVSGVALLGLVWFIGWTGYWLVWDQPAQQIATTSMRLVDALPVFGEPMGRLFIADRLVPSLLFFVVFFLHMLLPLGIAIGLAVHLLRVSRARLFPDGRSRSASGEARDPSIAGANKTWRERARRWSPAIAMLLALGVVSWLVPAPLDEPARMAEKPPRFTVDAWYLTPLALGLRLQGAGVWLALFGTGALGAALPWILGRRRPPAAFQPRVEVSRCHACTQCMQDCPFDAITMVARTDGKPFPSQAFVDPLRCVGCAVCAGSCDSEAMSLPWFDTRGEEARIEAEIAIARVRGAGPWVAFVGADIDGGMTDVRESWWREHLPGFLVHAVPTASWVRPKLVERLFRDGVRGVMIVRDARHEAAARDGGRWVADRLAGERKPLFRPARAGKGGAWRVVDFDAARPDQLRVVAADMQRGGASGVVAARPPRWRVALSGVALACALGAAVVGPSLLRVANPAPDTPEFVFSFKALGDWVEAEVDPAAEAAKPVHMRGRSTEKPRRADVFAQLTIDGRSEMRTFRAKGISRDGPAIDEWRLPLPVGSTELRIELQTGRASAPLVWQGKIVAAPRRLYALTFEPAHGFRAEWNEDVAR